MEPNDKHHKLLLTDPKEAISRTKRTITDEALVLIHSMLQPDPSKRPTIQQIKASKWMLGP